jgi:hypothetical protein
MLSTAFNELMQKALEHYRTDEGPVVVLAGAGGKEGRLHGEETLKTIVDTQMPTRVLTIRGVDVEQWNASEWPEILEAARRLFMQGRFATP